LLRVDRILDALADTGDHHFLDVVPGLLLRERGASGDEEDGAARGRSRFEPAALDALLAITLGGSLHLSPPNYVCCDPRPASRLRDSLMARMLSATAPWQSICIRIHGTTRRKTR